MDLLDHAASLYRIVATGEKGGDQNLLGPQGVPLWLKYFHNDNLTYAVNNWVGGIAVADRLYSQPTLRVLEIGAGTGSATEVLLRLFGERHLLPRLERYVVTEPNTYFRRCNQRKLAAQYPNLPLEWTTVDLDLPWSEQGIAPGEFDLVYAVNVMYLRSLDCDRADEGAREFGIQDRNARRFHPTFHCPIADAPRSNDEFSLGLSTLPPFQ